MEKRYGIVLAGGGAKGAFQIGVWKALIDRQIYRQIYGISGCSVGALNAFLMASGEYDKAEEIWCNISKFDFLNNINSQGSLFTRDGLIRIIRKFDMSFVNELDFPVYVNAFNSASGKTEYFLINENVKYIEAILLASSALPIVYPRVKIKNKLYIDGGVKENIPIRPFCIDKSIDEIIVVALNSKCDKSTIQFLAPCKRVHLIKPSVNLGGLISGTLDFDKISSTRRIHQGYKDALKYISNFL